MVDAAQLVEAVLYTDVVEEQPAQGEVLAAAVRSQQPGPSQRTQH